jgi:RNA-directed DNA polymerase
MTVTGTLPHAPGEWRVINWRHVCRSVRRLQIRIAEAMRARRPGKAHALRRILTRSLAAACWAVRKVTENQGSKTPGIDGTIWSTPEDKQAAIGAMRQGPYSPLPLRRIYIPKANDTRRRPISIPTMADRARQALHTLALEPMAEGLADPNSYGFRRERSPADAIGQCYITLAKRASPQWILEGDIASCFDKISQEWLVKHIPMDRGILAKWLKAGYIERHTFHATEEGTPQGGIVSPMLCNLTLDGLESALKERFPKGKVNLIRFADDFVTTGATKALLEQDVKPFIEAFLAERGLSLSKEKTRIVHIEEGFDFLGQNVRKYNGKLLIKPATQAVKAVQTKARRLVKQHAAATPAQVISQLNPLLRGWANYHRHVCSKKTFAAVDSYVMRVLWNWAKRRHPGKPRRWIKQRYFQTKAGKDWVFTGTDDHHRELILFKAANVPIQRHVKIRGNANPYDPTQEGYFEKRLAQKWAAGHYGHTRTKGLWLAQNGKCPRCRQLITEETGWHIHHKIPRLEGGPDTMDNLVLLHPTCHRQLHAQKTTP